MAEYPLYKENVFTVTPISARMTLEPGSSYEGFFKIANPIDAEKTLRYKVKVEQYSDVVDNEDNFVDLTDITSWVTLEENDGTLEPNEVRVINYKITVPEDAAGGGHYVALSVENVPEDATAEDALQIKGIMELSSILYITVNGDILFDGEVTEVRIPTVSFNNIVTTNVVMKNSGNVHQDALVKVEGKEHFGGDKVKIRSNGEDVKEEIDDGVVSMTYIVLPGATKSVNVEVAGLPEIGIFDLSETVYFNNTEYVNNQTVIMCPAWLIGTALAVFFALVLAIVFLFKRRKKNRAGLV